MAHGEAGCIPQRGRRMKPENEKSMGKRKLFCTMVKIGCIGFGGGNALIPVMQQELVEQGKVVSAEEFDEDVVVASITPGALPVEIAGGVGSRLHGGWGMLIGSVGMALPGTFLTVIFLASMSGVSETVARQIGFLAIGISAYIICMLMDYVVTTLRRALGVSSMAQMWLVIGMVFLLTCGKTLYRLFDVEGSPFFALATVHVFAIAFFLIFFLHGTRTPWRLAIAAIFSVLYVLCAGKSSVLPYPMFQIVGGCMLVLSLRSLAGSIFQGSSFYDVSFHDTCRELTVLGGSVIVLAVPAISVSWQAIPYIGSGILSSLMSFGGGDAYLTVADGLFVETMLVTEDEFYGTIVPLVNLLPGSILCKTLTGIGYYIGYDATDSISGAICIACAGFMASIAASCGVFSLVRCLYRHFQQLEIFHVVRQVIRPIVSGLLITVALALIYQAKKIGLAEGIGGAPVYLVLILSGINCWLYFTRNMSNVKILVISVGSAVVMCNLLAG